MAQKPEEIKLPPSTGEKSDTTFRGVRQIAIIGANGAGKTRFMERIMQLAGPRAYALSALSASFPEREESMLEGSVDDLYRKATSSVMYMQSDAVSELDKLTYMLFADELESLLDFKEKHPHPDKKSKFSRTKLDIIKNLWEKIFPGSRIYLNKGTLMFSTLAGDDLIEVGNLSQGEKAVLYYAAAVLYAMPQAVIFIDSPALFLHPAIINNVWNALERLRPDCTFVYNSVDVDFVGSRSNAVCIWVKSFDSQKNAWDYQILSGEELTEDTFVDLAGSRKPVLFIEGDTSHSIDGKLYRLVFNDWTVRPLGSCNKVIETTRSFNDLKYLHHLRSRGIVDRDRRTDAEVEYLFNKEILVPDVAEVENIFLLDPIIRIMARRRGKNAERIINRIHKEVIHMFKQQADQQALQHVRHRVKREVECKIDARFSCITALETHLKTLVYKLEPRKTYNELREQFARMVVDSDYDAILRVFNHKPMLPNSGLPQMLGFKNKEEYIRGVLEALAESGKDSDELRQAVKHCFRL